ncbi:hypothetical protein STEG23_005000, partial [Scotinomys teguina]
MGSGNNSSHQLCLGHLLPTEPSRQPSMDCFDMREQDVDERLKSNVPVCFLTGEFRPFLFAAVKDPTNKEAAMAYGKAGGESKQREKKKAEPGEMLSTAGRVRCNGTQIKAGHQQQRKFTNLWKLNNSLLNENWVNTETTKEIKAFLEFNENECSTYPNVSDTMKAALS